MWGRLAGALTGRPRRRDWPRLERARLPLGWLGLRAPAEGQVFESSWPHGVVTPSRCCREHVGLRPTAVPHTRPGEALGVVVGRRASRFGRSPGHGPAWQRG